MTTTQHANLSEQPARSGSVRYLDGSGLQRPFKMPATQRMIACALLLAALVIGSFLGYQAVNEVVGGSQRAAEQIEANLARDVALDLPRLADYAPLSVEDIRASLAAAGYTLFDANADGTQAPGLSLAKIPSDVTLEQAALMYAQGINNLSGGDASLLLNGSWRLTTDRSTGTSIRVRFVDFDAGTPEAALQSAIAAEGLDTSTLGESGVDDSGNTYQQGTIDIGGQIFSWQVSVCPLSGVYDIDGLPDDAMYVGVHLFTGIAG